MRVITDKFWGFIADFKKTTNKVFSISSSIFHAHKLKLRMGKIVTGVDFIFSRITVPYRTHHSQRRVQLDGHIPSRQCHCNTLRALGVLRPVGDTN